METTAVHTLDVPGPKPSIPTPAEEDAAISNIMSGIEDLTEAETGQLRALLTNYIDIVSTSNADLGRTDKLQHVINTEGPRLITPLQTPKDHNKPTTANPPLLPSSSNSANWADC